MNTRQKKKHDFYFTWIKGLEGYKRHRFVKYRRVHKMTRRFHKIWLYSPWQLRKLYKEGAYKIKYDYGELPFYEDKPESEEYF